MRIEKKHQNKTVTHLSARYFKVGAIFFTKKVLSELDLSKGFCYIDVENDKVVFTPTEDEEQGFRITFCNYGFRICCKALGSYIPEKKEFSVHIGADGSFWIPREE